MSESAVSHLAAMENGLLRVVTSLRGTGQHAGVCIEFYGRSPRNSWFEAVRVDGYIGDVHYHSFTERGAVSEHEISTTKDRGEVAIAVSEFVRARVRFLMGESGFGSAPVDEQSWEVVVNFVANGILSIFAQLSADCGDS